MKCPGCGYKRKKSNKAPEWQCPECKIAYNKHPDYKTPNEYELQVTYKLIPSNEEINPKTIYLYLNSQNELEYALLDDNGEIKRLHLIDNELNDHALMIRKLLTNTESLKESHVNVLFSAFSQKGYQPYSQQPTDKSTEYKKLLQQKNKKNKQIILRCTFLASIVTLLYFYSSNSTIKNIKSINTQEASKQEIQQKTVTNEPNPIKRNNLLASGINISFISSKLYVVNALVKECRVICQAHRKIDSSCDKANEIMKEIYPNINQYKDYFSNHNIANLQEHEQKIILEINQYLADIPKEIETAKNLCQRPVQVIKPQVMKIDFISKGINLSILHSKINTADNQIRDCRLNCEAGTKAQAGCKIFINLEKEYKSEAENLFNLMNKYSININSETLNVEDKEYIRQIFYLLDDVEKERKKIIDCINS